MKPSRRKQSGRNTHKVTGMQSPQSYMPASLYTDRSQQIRSEAVITTPAGHTPILQNLQRSDHSTETVRRGLSLHQHEGDIRSQLGCGL